jgi:ketosteroid isomerase-like protein
MRKVFLFAISLSSGIVLLIGCNSAKESKPAFDMAAARKDIEDGNKAFCDDLAKGDSVGLANLYTTDAKFMEPNAPVSVGRSNIQHAMAGYINAGVTKLSLKTVNLFGGENLLMEDEEWTLADKDGKPLDHGKGIVGFKKEEGKWKILLDCFNSDVPLPAPPPPAPPTKK